MIVAEKLQQMTKVETRCTTLGHIQRGGGPTPSDRLLATRFGVRAVELIAAGRLGLMVALRDGVIVDAPLAEAVEMQKLVDPEGELVQVARALGHLGGRPVAIGRRLFCKTRFLAGYLGGPGRGRRLGPP